MSRLEDTSRCPVADRCAICSGTEDLAVATAETPVGVLCQTLCATCGAAGALPRLGWAVAVKLVIAHCGHIGLDVDEASALMADERDED